MSRLPRGIPGNRMLPLIGTAWTYLPIIGTGDDPDRLTETYRRKQEKFGDIFAEKLGGKTVVSIFNPQDIENLYTNEGRLPRRSSLSILSEIRKKHPKYYASAGVVSANGEEWYNLRQELGKGIEGPLDAMRYFPVITDTSVSFLRYLSTVVSVAYMGRIPDILSHLYQWSFENLAMILLDAKVDLFRFQRNNIMESLVTCGRRFLSLLSQAEYSWKPKRFNKKLYHDILELDLLFYGFVNRHATDMIKLMDEGKWVDAFDHPCLMRTFMGNQMNDYRGMITTLSDYLFAGIYTTAIATAVTLHYLGHHQKKQQKLYQEIRRHWDVGEPLEWKHVFAMPYLKACVQEALRMHPVTLGTGRILDKDLKLAGFNVKKGTIVVTHTGLAGQLKKFVPRANEYIPERYISGQPPMPFFTALPFGYGPRSCSGKHIAELQIYTLVTQMVWAFRVVAHSPLFLKTKTALLNFPDSQIDIELTVRQDTLNEVIDN